jgi:hypothetical protein
MRALRLPARAFLVPYGFGSRLPRSLRIRARRSAPEAAKVRPRAWDFGQPVVPVPALRLWTRAGALRFPGDPSHAFALVKDPGRAGRTSPLAVLPMLSPALPHRRPLLDLISRLPHGFGIRCLRFTNDVAVAHARLASGWRAAPLPGGRRTLWIASKGFRFYMPYPFPGLGLTQGRSRTRPSTF